MLIMCNEDGRRQAEYLINSVIERGEFDLSSGGKTKWYFDAMRLRLHFDWFMKLLNPKYLPIGILTGGGVMVERSSYDGGIIDIKNESLYLPNTHSFMERGDVSLIDDVVTTGHALEEAERILNNYGFKVWERLALLDRRLESDNDDSILSIANLSSLFVLKLNSEYMREQYKLELMDEMDDIEADEDKYHNELLKIGLFNLYS